uniref:NADH-ubiquinone oxidoreductase chain 4 n=1 Tax=Acropyga panamensis TaxID=602222 RepID=A0A6G5NI84_9HYME|nr:NADH dehydrogenase subunit 4 [Acropyga panamensis]QBG38663.1 NADH dehydrogenase subunit 4 [Acropyga panamensis]
MMKMIIVFLFMISGLVLNKKGVFYYMNIYVISFMMLFEFMFKDDIFISISLYFGVDKYSYFLVILSYWIMGLSYMSIQGHNMLDNMYMKKLMIFLIMLLILIFFFFSMNLLLFYFMFELSLIPMFIMIIFWGMNYERLSASYYLLIYTMFISLPLLIYLFKLFKFFGSFDFSLLMMSKLDIKMGLWDYLILFLVFYVKLPIYIFHVWLPKAHVEAPVYGSMILAGILLKLGGYGLLRFMKIFLSLSVKYNYFILSVGIIGSLFTSLICLIQIDMKKLVAYSSVVHMNILMCSLLTLSELGFVSSYILMVSHGLCSSGLFYMVNLYYERSMSRLMFLNKGMMNLFFSLSIWWFLFCAANFSFPFSLSFFSEIFMINVIISWDMIIMLFLMFICFFSSAYSLYLYSYIQHGFIYIEEKLFMVYVKDFLILYIHMIPLVLFIFNMSMFY